MLGEFCPALLQFLNHRRFGRPDIVNRFQPFVEGRFDKGLADIVQLRPFDHEIGCASYSAPAGCQPLGDEQFCKDILACGDMAVLFSIVGNLFPVRVI